ncbi:hypothetical protein BGZ60DRAFT_532208 [Tricladium varicosporioides]|nr:hypothetical protein BGZ60DRAFT_532208 [Hymenoscyphus varicosporioides]
MRSLLRRPPLFRLPPSRGTRSYPRFQSSSSKSSRDRLSRMLNRLPSFLHPYTRGLLNAPVSHIASFLILHEITAIIPLIGLGSAFHWGGWLPEKWVEAKYVTDGVEKFGRYFRRKGWFGFSKEHDIEEIHIQPETIENQQIENSNSNTNANFRGTRILVEVATAYAITKVLLPIRVVLSVWATPWFARVVLGRVGGFMGRGKGVGSVKSQSNVTTVGEKAIGAKP